MNQNKHRVASAMRQFAGGDIGVNDIKIGADGSGSPLISCGS
jgi:hypothetical protein